MEAIMKRTTWAAALLLTILMIIGFGCSTDKSTDPGSSVKSVQVVMDTDTLKFVPGDSAVSTGFVVVTDQNGVVMKGISVSITITPVIGLIEYVNTELKDTTDDYGRVNFVFRSYNQPGNLEVKATVGNVAGTWKLWVQEASEIIESLSIQLVPDVLRVPNSSEDSSLIIVTIKDSNSVGIGNISVILQATGGRMKPLGVTDSTGRAQTWWYNNHEYGQFSVTARVANLNSSATINVEPLGGLGSLHLESSLKVIQADHCVTKAQIIATLKDQYSTPVIGDTIRFSTPGLGSAYPGVIVTDSSGQAKSAFCEYSTPSSSSTDSALVIARYTKWNLIDTVRIFIEQASDVKFVSIVVSPTQGTAGVDSASVTVRAFFDSLQTLPVNGLWAYFHATCGMFTMDRCSLVAGTHLDTPIRWKFCDHTTNALNPAKIWVTVGPNFVTSDTIDVDVNPGDPRLVALLPDAYIITMNDQVGVTASIYDSLGNSVNAGIPVNFSSTLGTLSPTSPVMTDQYGTARITLTPATQAGQALVTAIVDSVYTSTIGISILSGAAASIELSVPMSSPQVRGTGGVDRTLVIASVKDVNGNAVQDGQWVYFSIIGNPNCGGCFMSADSVQTTAGEARVYFNSGTIPGPVNIQACTYMDTLYCVNASNISVVAGPPHSIILQPTDVGVDVDGVAWDIQIGALVGDLYNNPVRDSIAVYFELEPAIALVVSDTVITGNGTHHAGVAVATIRYPSDQTFQTVNVTAYTAEPNRVSTTISYILPLQTPTITLNCQPSTWHFPADGTPWCLITCGVLVKDQHNRLINGAKVIYSVTRGRFWTTAARTLQRNWNKTGPDFGFDNGYTHLILSEQEQYLFPPNSTEITADVQAEIEGTGVIDGQSVNFRRGTGR